MVTKVLERFAEQSSIKCDFSPKFDKFFKKNRDRVLEDKLLDKMEEICENPYIGKKKHGKIDDVYSHKFYHYRTQYIISYEVITVKKENHKSIEFVKIDDRGDEYKAIERYKSTSKRK